MNSLNDVILGFMIMVGAGAIAVLVPVSYVVWLCRNRYDD